MPEPKPNGVLHIAVTGAAGQIAYSLLPLIASGSVFGTTQRMTLRLLEIPRALDALNGVCMELTDGAYPLVESVLPTADAAAAFSNADIVILVGAFPRLAGMERSALLAKNATIFKAQGVALSENASPNVRTVVVGNPANTNAMVLSRFAEGIPPRQITALTRLDHNRAVGQVALQCGVKVDEVEGVCIWGNHSSTQYPDISRATAKGENVFEKMGGEMSLAENFIPLIQKRGAAVISARGSSSAMSAAKGIADHMKSWICGDDKVVSMAVPSDGSYGIEEGVWYSYPVRCIGGGEYEIVTGIEVNDFSRKYMDLTAQELFAERKDAIAMLEES